MSDDLRAKRNSDAIEVRIRIPTWWCSVCDRPVLDPENHHFHAVIDLPADAVTERPEKP